MLMPLTYSSCSHGYGLCDSPKRGPAGTLQGLPQTRADAFGNMKGNNGLRAVKIPEFFVFFHLLAFGGFRFQVQRLI